MSETAYRSSMEVKFRQYAKYWSVNNRNVLCWEVYFEEVKTKSRAGVEYSHYIPMMRIKTQD